MYQLKFPENVSLSKGHIRIIRSSVICRLKNNGMNATDAYQYFVLRVQKLALSHGYEIINW